MSNFYLTIVFLIFATVIIGLLRVFRGPTRADRMLAAQLCGTASVAIFMLLGFALEQGYLFDMALIFAVLTAVSTIIFIRLTWQKTNHNLDSNKHV